MSGVSATSPRRSDYVIEGPLSGFVKDKEIALDFAKRIAEAACQILKDRKTL